MVVILIYNGNCFKTEQVLKIRPEHKNEFSLSCLFIVRTILVNPRIFGAYGSHQGGTHSDLCELSRILYGRRTAQVCVVL